MKVRDLVDTILEISSIQPDFMDYEVQTYRPDNTGRHYVERCTRIEHDKTMVIESWEFA